MDAQALKQRHRDLREDQPEALRMRIHRAISWLARSEREQDDPDARFIFLWIAFNAAYASEFGFEKSEHDQANAFVERVLAHDAQQHLHRTLFEQFTGPIRTLIENRYVFEPFWRALRNHESDGAWKVSFEASRKRAMHALMNGETATLLSIVLTRLYVLRNQLIHGGATWNGQTNRGQVKDGVAILSTVVPIIIDLMLQADPADFDEVAFPVV